MRAVVGMGPRLTLALNVALAEAEVREAAEELVVAVTLSGYCFESGGDTPLSALVRAVVRLREVRGDAGVST